MAANPFISPKARFLDANGNPLAGGMLYTYEAGTTTPLDTYTTREQDIPNPNPVPLSETGEADIWLIPGRLYKFELRDVNENLQWTVDNVPSPEEGGAAEDAAAGLDPGGRLTLSSGTPVTTSNVTSSTVYYVPYKHNQVPLYDGSAWALHTIATELSQALSDDTKSPGIAVSNTCYDLFIWDDSGTLRCTRGPAWTSITARGTGAGTTELERVGGRYVNAVSISNGPAAQRGLYVGTIFADASAQANDSLAARDVWNMYSRCDRPMSVMESTDSWTYSTATLRIANNNNSNFLEFVVGLSEDLVSASVVASARNTAGSEAAVAIGLDSNTARASGSLGGYIYTRAAESNSGSAEYRGYPGIGRHALVWLEWSAATPTTTWYGDNGGAIVQSGITGTVRA